MRRLATIAFCAVLWQNAAPAQRTNMVPPPDENVGSADRATGVVGAAGANMATEFAPLTASERWALYFRSTFGPRGFLTAAAGGGIAQWSGTPKEWGGGAKAYGERVGNTFAEHVIRKTMEAGAAAALHEDNRYVYSTDTAFWPRTRHVVASVFTARDEAGRQHFAYSRFGGAAGSAVISRIWQPHSMNTSGDAAVNFGISIATDLGWNAFREFRPRRWKR